MCCAVKTLCESEHDSPNALGSSKVECEIDGSFKPMQCTHSQTECWCVDGLGHKMPKTHTPIYIPEHKPNCGASFIVIHKPQCYCYCYNSGLPSAMFCSF